MSRLLHKPFYFLRHGETDWNKNHIAMGQTDIELNGVGLAQSYKAAEDLRKEKFTSIACSPLKRALQTANIISEHYSLPITIIDELKEASFGVMEGQPKGDRAWIDEWRIGGHIDKAEVFQDFVTRALEGLNSALNLPAPVLIVSHGGVYWAVQKALGLPCASLNNCVPMFHRPPTRLGYPWFVHEVVVD
jgi:probable phosphoglycerate mutase